jgi:ATP-dependent RNA helicase DeaD
MICRRGGIDRQAIGAIRILDTSTEFEISQSAAEAFAAQIKRPDKDDNIRIEPLIGAKPLEPSNDKPAFKPHDGKKPDRDARRDKRPDSWSPQLDKAQAEPRREAFADKPHGAPRGKSFHDERAPRVGKEAEFKAPSFKKDGFKKDDFKKPKSRDDKPAYVSKARRADPSAPSASFKKKAKKTFRD